jgi:FAD-dependent oxidoreductase family protein
MRIGGVGEDAPITSEAMRRAVAFYNATHERQLGRDHGPAARLPLSGELTMQIVDETADALDGEDLTRAEVAARAQAWDYLDAFREHIEGWQNAYLIGTGPQIGIRESRHVIGRYAITRDDVVSRDGHGFRDRPRRRRRSRARGRRSRVSAGGRAARAACAERAHLALAAPGRPAPASGCPSMSCPTARGRRNPR